MNITILSIFPDFFKSIFNYSIIGRAIQNNIVKLNIEDIRNYSNNKHRKVDDYPFGGGPGMLMAYPAISQALKANKGKVIYTSPRGSLLSQRKVNELSKEKEIVILCGHYEGVDQRIIDKYVDEEISIGDYILSGGEAAAIVLIDSIVRKINGVIKEESSKDESFDTGLLEHNQYTRPREIDGLKVPDYLISGNHKLIKDNRIEESIRITKKNRLDIINKNLNNKFYDSELEQKIIKILKEDEDES